MGRGGGLRPSGESLVGRVDARGVAKIVCGDEKKSYGGSFKKDANANEATLVIANLPVKELKGKACTEIQVMEKNAAKFSAAVTDIKFDEVKKGDLKVFPDKDDATKRYVVKAIPVGGGGTAGQTYETVDSLAGGVQMDKLNAGSALVLVQVDNGPMNLKTVPLP